MRKDDAMRCREAIESADFLRLTNQIDDAERDRLVAKAWADLQAKIEKQMTDDDELKDCPFCGSPAEIVGLLSPEGEARSEKMSYDLRCSQCWVGARFGANRQAAVTLWNQRAPTPEKRALQRINRVLSPVPDRDFDRLITNSQWCVAEARRALNGDVDA